MDIMLKQVNNMNLKVKTIEKTIAKENEAQERMNTKPRQY